MDYQITLKLVLLFFFFLLSAFFSCSEAALFSLTPLHLHKMETERSLFLPYIRRLLLHPRRLLITIIVGNEAVNVTISVLATALAVYFFDRDGWWIAVAVVTPLILVGGEAFPKIYGVVHPVLIASIVSPLLTLLARVEYPVIWILEKISGWFVALFPEGAAGKKNILTEDEFRLLIDAGEKGGALESVQRDLIHRVFDLGDKPVSEVMVPRVEMFCLPLSMGRTDMRREIIRARHSYVPIYGADRDDIVGILFAGDIMDEENVPLPKLLKKPYFVPLERTVLALVQDFQRRRPQSAIVVDEYGGVSGLVTLADILESLFEDMYDEDDARENDWQRIDARTLVVSGSMATDEFTELTGVAIPNEDFDTISGFVFHLFGKLPVAGEEVCFGDHTFRVEKMGRSRILKLRVEKRAALCEEGEADG